MGRGAALALLLGSFAAAAETLPPCLSDKTPYLAAVAHDLRRFETEIQRASYTSRIVLNVEVDSLGRIRRETARLAPPPCAEKLQKHVLGAMDFEIRTVRKFLRMSDAELARWERAAEPERRRILDRTRSEQSWRLVAFEINILRQRSDMFAVK